MSSRPPPIKPTGALQYLLGLGKRLIDVDIRAAERRRTPPRRPGSPVRFPPPQPVPKVITLDEPSGELRPGEIDKQREEAHHGLDVLYNRAIELESERDELLAKLGSALELADRAHADLQQALSERDDAYEARAAARRGLIDAEERLLTLERERFATKRSIDDLRASVTEVERERDAAQIEATTLNARLAQLELDLATANERVGHLETTLTGRRRFRRGRRLRRVGGAILTLGILVGLFGLYETVWTSAVTKRDQADLRQTFRAELVAAATVRAEPPARVAAPVISPRTGSAVGRLRIRKIGLDVIVVQGIGRNQLAKGPGVYPQTAPLGTPGATAIAGHRNGWGSPFSDVDRLARGDRITVQTSSSTYAYRVTRIVVVSPDEGWVLAGDPDSAAPRKLVLTTCTPPFLATHRLVIWADLVSASSRNAARA